MDNANYRAPFQPQTDQLQTDQMFGRMDMVPNYAPSGGYNPAMPNQAGMDNNLFSGAGDSFGGFNAPMGGKGGAAPASGGFSAPTGGYSLPSGGFGDSSSNPFSAGSSFGQYAQGGMVQQAGNVARQGRYGDSTLLHVNPQELQGIAALSPNGQLTRNPVTGYPEAFSLSNAFKMLAPMLGSAAMVAATGGTALAAYPALMGGIGSGLTTAAMTGDIRRGLVSGLMGAGIGKALGTASSAATDATTAITDAATTVPVGAASDVLQNALPPMSGFEQTAMAAQDVAASAASGAVQQAPSTFMSNLKQPWQAPKGQGFAHHMMQSKSMIPFAVGAGQLAQMDAQEEWEEQAKKLAGDKEARLKSSYDDLQRGYRAAQPYAMTGVSPYRSMMSNRTPPPTSYASGGIVSLQRYAHGGSAHTDPNYPGYVPGQRGARDGYGGIDPVTVQANLRGQYSVAPPPGYMPGFSPEFIYFQNDPNNIQSPPITGPADWTQMYVNSPINQQFMQNPNRMTDAGQPVNIPMPPGYNLPPLPPVTQPPGGTDPNNPNNPNNPYDPVDEFNKKYRRKPVQKPPPDHREPPYDLKEKAAGGEIQLDSSLGTVGVPAGGVANIPTEFSQQPQQGDPLSSMQPEHVQMLMAVTLQPEISQAQEIIQLLIKLYGEDTVKIVQAMLLQSQAPEQAQRQGLIKGQGGGMDDEIMGMIDGQQPVAVSSGEYIVPADVVSGLGDGSSEAGSAELDKMMSNVRMARGGTVSQPPPTDASRLLPK